MTISRGRRVGFYVATGIALAVVVGGLAEILLFAVVGWMDPATLEAAFPGAEIHRIHGLGHGLLAWTMLVCVLAQLWRSRDRYAVAVVGLLGVVLYTVATVVGGIFDGLELVAIAAMGAIIWLHPGSGPQRLRPLSRRPWLLAAPLLIGALAYTFTQVSDQFGLPAAEPHVVIGHYGLMAAMALTVGSAVFLGTSALSGARSVGWIATAAALFFGLASILYPGYSSSPGVFAGIVVVVYAGVYGWGVARAPATR